MPMMLPTVGTQCDSRIKLKLNQSQFPEDSTPPEVSVIYK